MGVENYIATLKLSPITDGNRSFAEWTAEFDCAPARAKELAQNIGQGVFQAGFDALKARLGGRDGSRCANVVPPRSCRRRVSTRRGGGTGGDRRTSTLGALTPPHIMPEASDTTRMGARATPMVKVVKSTVIDAPIDDGVGNPARLQRP